MPKPATQKKYVGPLDLVHAPPLVALSCARALSKITRGDPLIRVQRTLDGAIETFRSDTSTGLIDKAAVDDFTGSRTFTRQAISAPAFSDVVALDDTTGVRIGMHVTGSAGIPEYGVYVRGITGSQVQLTMHLALGSPTPMTFTDIGGIEMVFDQSGNRNHATQPDVVQQPVWASDFSIGGMSTMTKFNPQERGGQLATINPTTIPAGAFTLFAVSAFEDTGYGSLTPLIGIDGMDDIFSVYAAANFFGHSSLSHEMYDGTNYGEWSSADLGAVAYETPYVSNILFRSSGGSTSFFNGTEFAYTGDAATLGAITGRLAIGSNDARLTAVSFKGDIGEVILYGDRLADQDGVQVRKNMADAWSG